MKRLALWLLASAFAAGTLTAAAAAEKKDRLTLTARRAGWMLGMFVGEGPGQPYPFISQVDPESDARLKGVRPGDELVRFEGDEVTRLANVFDKVSKLRPGKEVQIWVRRGVQTMQFKIRVPREATAPPVEKEPKPGDPAAAPAGDKAKKPKKKPPVVIKPVPIETNDP